MDKSDIVAALALAAINGGAAGVRIEGVANVREVRKATSAPIIGLIKRDLADSLVRITPFLHDVHDLIEAGADIVAFDATFRSRPIATDQLCASVRAAERVAMADISNLDEARQAFAEGADVVGTTLSGYTGVSMPIDPDFELLANAVALGRPVIAEGRIRDPSEAAQAIRLGAFAVVVGTAITRTEIVTEGFVRAIVELGAPRSASIPETR